MMMPKTRLPRKTKKAFRKGYQPGRQRTDNRWRRLASWAKSQSLNPEDLDIAFDGLVEHDGQFIARRTKKIAR